MAEDPLTRYAERRNVTFGQTRVSVDERSALAHITRPAKIGGTHEYMTEVAIGQDIIRDNEVDGDLDTVFAAHNQLVDAFNALSIPTTFPVTIGATAPTSPDVGQLWWRTTDGNLYIYYDDGTTAQWVPAMASVGKLLAGQYYLLAGAVTGVPPAGVAVGLYVSALAFSLPANLSGSQAVAKTAATAQTDFTLSVNGTAQGTMRWAAGATVATFLSSAVALAIGDRVEITAPGTADATLADVSWTLRGSV
jgi:hypothetical protein